MGEAIDLTAQDGFVLAGYKSMPEGAPKGGIVILQENKGLTDFVRDTCDIYAAAGYAAVAPALFDRVERGVELETNEADRPKAKALSQAVRANEDQLMADVEAARLEALSAGGTSKVGVVGFCFGGTVAWMGCCRLQFDAAVNYYGTQIMLYKDETPGCPVILHIGDEDRSITPADGREVEAMHDALTTYVYAGGEHGFNNHTRAAYHPHHVAVAGMRSIRFLDQHLG